MRPLLFAILTLVCHAAAAQPSVNIGIGGMGSGAAAGDCRDVARQIVREWMDVHELMTGDSDLGRPSPNQFQCVSPAELQGAMPKHVGASDLRCYAVAQSGVCCDAQMSSCAALAR